MPLVRFTVWGLRCLRCGHQWVPFGLEQTEDGKKPSEPEEGPRVCPRCKSPYWNRPRRSEAK